jgi:endonuclease/exonuclease/phosphatase family metal-dependent hydrolase
MIKVITANLLAETPYRKYAQVARLDFGERSEKFRRQIVKLMPDILLLQEVDTGWREYLEQNILKLGYSLQVGKCWSSGLAILWRSNVLEPAGSPPLNVAEAGILAVEFVNLKSRQLILMVNLHAPWGRAKEFAEVYASAIGDNRTVLIAGDLNTDCPEKNDNASYFFTQLFTPEKGFRELTDNIPFTARNVRSNEAEKLDYMIGLNVFGSDSQIHPEVLSLLLPHSAGGEYAPDREDNHFSDHALVVSTINT